MQNHAVEMRHAANGFASVMVYAACTCGWESSRYPLNGAEVDGTDLALLFTECAAREHVEQATSSRF